ncbi:hypothetical protein [Alkalibacter mobilis]|uniref:hypothetical protein n=1 Tax=Alkalibacter mobilis TaxID=2787712 RepID=UPI00189F0C90|nr:hypothetical protein [Alkalibacter mobilis]MBF7097040.1 hypothetical protein [Alkalibacter mobilis]
MKKIAVIFMFLICAMSSVYANEVVVDTYESQDGIEIISYVENWKGDKLIEVYEELLKNKHGDEIEYLDRVNLYPGESPNGNEEGIYFYTLKKLKLLGSTSIEMEKGSHIDIYNMNEKNKVEDFARVLSHEYGHHFTIYYLAKNDKNFFIDWTKSDFYKVRQGGVYEQMESGSGVDHKWLIEEICAEDYVQIYGSLTGKIPVDVFDIEDKRNMNVLEEDQSYTSSAYNIIPQENMEIGLAAENPNVLNYWSDLSGIAPDVEIYSIPEITLGSRNEYERGYYSQIISWTGSYTEYGDEAKAYTLVAFDKSGKWFLPIKTVYKGEAKEAVVGTVMVQDNGRKKYYTDTFLGEDLKLAVVAVGNRGEAVSSGDYVFNAEDGVLSFEGQEDLEIVYSEMEIKTEKGIQEWIIEFLDGIMYRFFNLLEKIK